MSSIRIEDVAKHAGVSMKTVSRVLNNEPNVREKTRERVAAAVSELNYRPNPSARSLAGNRSYLVGLLYSSVAPAYLINIQSGVIEACNGAHYGLVLHPCSDTGNSLVREVESFVLHSRVDGLILTPPISDCEPLVARLNAAGINHVRISPMDPDVGASVSIDERRAAEDIMEHLLGLGHRRIGFIRGPKDHGASHWRFESYKSALASAGINFDGTLVADADFTYESGVDSGSRLLALADPPTAIFASNDDMAAGVLHVAHDRGIPVPKELSVAGFDDSPLANQVWPRLTTIHQPMRRLGSSATTQLLRMIQQPGTGEQSLTQQVLDFELKLRESTGPAPKRSKKHQ